MPAAWDGAVSASEEDGEGNDALGALSNHYRGDDDFDYDVIISFLFVKLPMY